MPKTLIAAVVAALLLGSCAHAPSPTGATKAAAATRSLKAVKPRRDGPATATGIPLDTPWKQAEYTFAQKNVKHPAWGLSHSERDLQNALALAVEEQLVVDKDVLFAAAYLHDLGGLDGFSKPGVDHAVRSAELAGPLLQGWGFPMDKLPLVKDVILGHVYYGPAPTGPEARVFHDADLLDFLGPMGVVRLAAATQDGGPGATLGPSLDTARKFATDLPGKLTTSSARSLARERVAQMQGFFQELDAYTFDGNAL